MLYGLLIIFVVDRCSRLPLAPTALSECSNADKFRSSLQQLPYLACSLRDARQNSGLRPSLDAFVKIQSSSQPSASYCGFRASSVELGLSYFGRACPSCCSSKYLMPSVMHICQRTQQVVLITLVLAIGMSHCTSRDNWQEPRSSLGSTADLADIHANCLTYVLVQYNLRSASGLPEDMQARG